MRSEQGTSRNPFARLVACIAGVLAMIAAVTFSVFLLAIALGVGLGAWIYFTWRKRKLRRWIEARGVDGMDGAHGARRSAGSTADKGGVGDIIEGEATRIADE